MRHAWIFAQNQRARQGREVGGTPLLDGSLLLWRRRAAAHAGGDRFRPIMATNPAIKTHTLATSFLILCCLPIRHCMCFSNSSRV